MNAICRLLIVLTLLTVPVAGSLQPSPEQELTQVPPTASPLAIQIESVREALIRLPLAAALGAALAFRPKRRGTPPRSPAVVQTQIILSVVGAVVMIVVGASLARAFAIVGAANLIRYRAKIDDPKDAGVMLATLTVGLACGVGLYALAAFGTVFIMVVLGAVESLEPDAARIYTLKVVAKPMDDIRPKIEDVLRRRRLPFEVRSATDEEVTYDVRVPVDRHVGHLPDVILDLGRDNISAVEWEAKKNKKSKVEK